MRIPEIVEWPQGGRKGMHHHISKQIAQEEKQLLILAWMRGTESQNKFLSWKGNTVKM